MNPIRNPSNMSFTAKSMKLTIAKIANPLQKTISTQDILEKLACFPIGDVSSVKDEPKVGFAGWRHMQAAIDETNCIVGGHLRFQFVIASRSVPASILRDECRRAELAYMQANNTGAVPSKERKRIKLETRDRLLMSFPVSKKGIEIAIDSKTSNVFIDSTSAKDVEGIYLLFFRATSLEIVPVSLNMMEKISKDQVKPLSINSNKSEFSTATIPDFLTWFWYYTEETGGKLDGKEYESMVEGPLTMRSDSHEPTGAMVATLRNGGLPQVSSEAKAALLIGKKLVKCRIVIAKSKQVWDGNFNADAFSFSGLGLPEGDATSSEDRFIEAIESLDEFSKVIQLYFDKFIKDSNEKESFEDDLNAWAKERKAL